MTQKTIELPAAGGPQVRTARRAALDAERYTTRDFMRQEWDAIWSRCWLYAGLVSDVADAGDYFLFNVGRESVVVTRSDDGQLRAFYNVCQHRGNRLLAAGSGVVSRFACPYHGWQYGLDGDRKSTRLNSSHSQQSRMPSSA